MLLAAAALVFASHANAQSIEVNDFDLRDIQETLHMDVETFTGTEVQTKLNKFDPAVFQTNSWINEFENVIVINKANTGSSKQSMVVYQRGVKVLETKVSTGREKQEPKKRWIFGKGAKYSYFSSTNTGYYTPTFTSRLHKSKLWKSYMPYSVFFDGGTAIHQAPEGTEYALGTRASGGCVRASLQASSYIFNMVNASGKGMIPAFTKDGQPVLQANGDVKRREGYKTLVIVEDIVE